jgi:hypothetical protein
MGPEGRRTPQAQEENPTTREIEGTPVGRKTPAQRNQASAKTWLIPESEEQAGT